MKSYYDIVIVGGGTSGVTTASVLREYSNLSILLVEAGSEFLEEEADFIMDGNLPALQGLNWTYDAHRNEKSPASDDCKHNRASKILGAASKFININPQLTSQNSVQRANKLDYPVAKVLGGGSLINGCMAFMPIQKDIDAWQFPQGSALSWSGFYKEINSANSKFHIPIEISQIEHLTTLQRSFSQSCLSYGFKFVDSSFEEGIQLIPKNKCEARRVSVVDIFLRNVDALNGLDIITNAVVDKLVFEKSKNDGIHASAVELIVNGVRQRVFAGKVILAAGAINSPLILMRSGVGKSDELKSFGIEPIVDLPGVGENLQDHCVISMWSVPTSESFNVDEPIHQVMLRKQVTQSGPPDINLLMTGAMPTSMFPSIHNWLGADHVAGISVILATPCSTGKIKLKSNDPCIPPEIYLNLLSDTGDVSRVIEGVRLAWGLTKSEHMIRNTKQDIFWIKEMITSDSLIRDVIINNVRPCCHPTGTLKMGDSKNRNTVVDYKSKVIGLDNVYVCDTSIFPTIPSVPTNITAILAAKLLAKEYLNEFN